MVADSRMTMESEAGGARVFRCEKLYRKAGAIIGLAGDSGPGLVFLDWYGTGRAKPTSLIDGDADFTALVLTKKGLFEYDKWCRGEKVIGRFYAIGSGAKAALGALHMGATARRAVEIACRVDPYSAPPLVSIRLKR
jgi:hypothetical protein